MAKIMKWEHNALCEYMAEYCRKKMNAGIVFVEHKTCLTNQIPDVLMFRPNCTVELEIKVQRGDFLQDKKKPHRADPSLGVGDYRFYVAPKGMIKVKELPKNWGLLEVSGKRVYKTHVPKSFNCLYGNREYLLDQLKESYKILRHEIPDKTNKFWKESAIRNIRHTKNDLIFIFPEKNIQTELQFLYAAHRQEIIANQQNLVLPRKGIIWTRPFGGDMMDERRLIK